MKLEGIGPSAVVMTDFDWFDIDKTFDCAQMFRAQKQSDVHWAVLARTPAGNTAAALFGKADSAIILAYTPGTLDFWKSFIGADLDYKAINKTFDIDPFPTQVVEQAEGLRLLKQDPWECLVSFLISQNNSVGNIKNSIDRVCATYGKICTVESLNLSFYEFPSPEDIAAKGYEGLYACSLGYRAEYIELLCKKLLADPEWLNTLGRGAEGKDRTDLILEALQSLRGVGPKVANCVALFAYQCYECFPVDVWIKRMIQEHYQGISPASKLGAYAGIFQEYLYFVGR